jgi:hypothetical protein
MVEMLQAHFMKWKNKQYMVVNKVPKELQSKVKTFLEAVNTNFSFLSNYGYKIKEEKVATQYVVKNIIEVLFKNEELDRVVLIHYEPNDLNGNTIDLISVSLFNGIRLLNKKLLLELYIKKYKSDLKIEHLTYPSMNNKTTFEENMNTSLAGFAYFLHDTGINLVNGTEWEDGLIYDWSSAEKMLYNEQKRILGDNNFDNK